MVPELALLVLAGLVVWLERSHRMEQAAWRLERASLLQRIQAPVLAVHQHEMPVEAENPPAVNPEMDDDYWDAAAGLMQRMERIERGVSG